MIYKVVKKNSLLNSEITLPASKSESNRLLIVQALCSDQFTIHNLSLSQDTQNLAKQIQLSKFSTDKVISLDVGAAGSSMRFLTAYLALMPGYWILKGSDRMHERPIFPLVDALKQLGANIEYLENKGFPPLRIEGSKLMGKEVIIDASKSSQYLSALLLIAPCLPCGLNVNVQGITSHPYVMMTLKIMEHFGIKHKWKGNSIVINKQDYEARSYTIESDWTAASYWYQMAALASEVNLTLYGLKKNSLQGDKIIAEIMKSFNVETNYYDNHVVLKKNKSQTAFKNMALDFSDYPDLAQTIIVTMAALKISGTVSGLSSLKIKECDRIFALKEELKKINVELEEIKTGTIKINSANFFTEAVPTFSTYDDHRMAMALAPLSLKFKEINIKNPDVVAKSYPNYWNDLTSTGYEINTIT